MGQRTPPRGFAFRSIVLSVALAFVAAACGRTAPTEDGQAADTSISSTTPVATTSTTIAPTTEPAVGDIYVIQPGDSLGKIAKAYGLTSNDLAVFNNIENPDRIKVGEPISIPPGATSTTTTPTTAAAPPADEATEDAGTGLAEPAPTTAAPSDGAAEEVSE